MKFIIKAFAGLAIAFVALSFNSTSVSAATYCTDYTYGYGSSGSCVRELQNMVNKTYQAYGYMLGYRTPLVTDGIYGANTKSAVLNIQNHAQLKSGSTWFDIGRDGVAGPQTWSMVCYYGDYNWSNLAYLKSIGCVRYTYNNFNLWQYLGYKGISLHY